MRLHKLLLYLYPASFRNEYGDELSRVFRERRRQATNPLAIVALWLREFVDILVNAFHTHVDILRQDLRYTVRTLSRARGFTVAAIVVTGLGIGANTASFSLTDRLLLRPLPFADSDRLVQLWQRTPAYQRIQLSPPNFYDWRRLSTSFEAMSAYAPSAFSLVGEGEPRRLEGTTVTPDFFKVLGVQPLLGRVFSEDDGRTFPPRTVILSYEFWQTRFGGRTDVLGKAVRLDNNSYDVIGVMPPNFFFPSRGGQLWMPLILGDPPRDARDNLFLEAIAKLKPAISIEKARTEFAVITDRLARDYPKENEKTGAVVNALGPQLPDQTRVLLWALLGASFCLLMITCANLANLLLAKAMTRRKELAVRTAIGAGRERLMRQLLTESLVVALAGGSVGVLVAIAALPVLSAIVTTRLPFEDATVLDGRVLAFTALVTLVTGLVFGVLPAWRACRGVNHDQLREGSRSGMGGRREWLRSALVVSEITISLVLLVSAGLLIRALWRVQSIDPGFRSNSVLAVQTWLPMPRYGSAATRSAFYSEILSNVRSLPGVSNAAYISSLPMTGGGGIWPVTGTGAEANERDASGTKTVGMRMISPAYFDTMGIPLRAGRDFSESDGLGAAPVAVVSESFARRYWPGQDPLGRKFHFAFNDFEFAQQERVIVGVVGEVRFRGLERTNEPQVYLSSKQLPDRTATFYAPRELIVRASVDSAGLVPAIRRIVRTADPELPISAVRMLQDVVELQTAPRSTQIRLVAAFAGLAILLAGTGIYGLLSFAVGQRVTERGMRIAPGSRSKDLLSIVL